MDQGNEATQHKYTSNPFAAAAVGLGKALTVNPIATLMLFVPLLVIVAAWYALFTVFYLVTAANYTPVWMTIGSVALAVATLFVVVRASLGAIFVLKASYEQNTTTTRQAMLKGASPYVWRYLGIIIAFFLLFVVAGILGGLISGALDDASAVVIVAAVVILAACAVAVRWSLAPFVLVNENAGVRASLKRSFTMTKGHFIEMVGVIIAQSVISGNGLLSIVGSVSGLDTRYHEIKAYQTAKSAKPAVNWMNWFLIGLFALGFAAYIWVFSLAADTSNDPFNFSSNSSSSSSTTYCYFDDSFDYSCADNESACKAIADCKSMLDSRESFDSLLDSYNVD